MSLCLVLPHIITICDGKSDGSFTLHKDFSHEGDNSKYRLHVMFKFFIMFDKRREGDSSHWICCCLLGLGQISGSSDLHSGVYKYQIFEGKLGPSDI